MVRGTYLPLLVSPTLRKAVTGTNNVFKKSTEAKWALGLEFLFSPSAFLCGPGKSNVTGPPSICSRTLVPKTGSQGLAESLQNIPQCPKLEVSTCSLP